jgi:hypothetical protein
LKRVEQFLIALPASPSISVLSRTSWNPYSQYLFSKDGLPLLDSNEPLSAQTSVPEVLCIDLPTGFDVSEFNKPPSNPGSQVNLSRPKPIVDLPIEEFPRYGFIVHMN